jgi:hypothetical protein
MPHPNPKDVVYGTLPDCNNRFVVGLQNKHNKMPVDAVRSHVELCGLSHFMYVEGIHREKPPVKRASLLLEAKRFSAKVKNEWDRHSPVRRHGINRDYGSVTYTHKKRLLKAVGKSVAQQLT